MCLGALSVRVVKEMPNLTPGGSSWLGISWNCDEMSNDVEEGGWKWGNG